MWSHLSPTTCASATETKGMNRLLLKIAFVRLVGAGVFTQMLCQLRTLVFAPESRTLQAYARAARTAQGLLDAAVMQALGRLRTAIVTCALVLAGIAALGETVVLLSYGPPAAPDIQKGSTAAIAEPKLEHVAAQATTVADNHARLSTVSVSDIDRVLQPSEVVLARYSQGNSGGIPPNGPPSTPPGGPPAGGPSEGGLERAGAVSQGTVAQVPEPSSMLLIGLGLAGAVAIRRWYRAH